MTAIHHTRRTKIALAVTGALTLSMVSGHAAASVYGGSRLLISNLIINIFDTDGTELNTAAGNFQFSLENTATLNGASAPSSNGFCSGLPGIPAGGTNDCSVGPPTLDAGAANAPGSTVNRANNDFTYFGPGAEQYANSDSVIDTAELTLDPTTNTRQIAEAELQTGASASANTEIQSTTALNLIIQLPEGPNAGQPYRLELAFDADPDLLAEIIQGADFQGGNTQANVNFTVGLTQDGTGDQVSWAPQGTVANTCDVDAGLAGVVCTEDDDGEDLNRSLSVSDNPATASFSRNNGVASAFGITVTGLTAGTYSLSLNGVTSVSMNQRFQPVASPGVLSLLGLGLFGIGVLRRRKAA